MQPVELKLKQASAVLGVDPKDLQNLVQFKVLRPPRRAGFYWFDNRLLLEAKVAFYLKELPALSDNFKEDDPATLRYVWIRSRPAAGVKPLEVRIPIGT
jgi:hypothetical protein